MDPSYYPNNKTEYVALVGKAYPEFSDDKKRAPIWNHNAGSYNKSMRIVQLWKGQAEHLVRNEPDHKLTGPILIKQGISAGMARGWLDEPASFLDFLDFSIYRRVLWVPVPR